MAAAAEKTRPEASEPTTGGIAADRLRSIVDRIERLEEVLRAIIRIRKQEPAEVEEQETLIDVYRRALGM
jgi:uncharacterized protein (UPF0335 family)